MCICAFPQVVNKRYARNDALSFDGPESPERPDRVPPRVNLLAAEAKALAPGAPPAQRPNPLSLPVAYGGDLGGSAFVPPGV